MLEARVLKSRKVLLLLSLFCVLSAGYGCSAKGPAFTPVATIPAEKSLIYVYRPSGFLGGGVHYDVYAGQEKVCNLVQGGYCQYFGAPGEIEIWGKTESKGTITIDSKVGQTTYVKAGVGMGFLVGRPNFTVVDTTLGGTEIKDCKLSVD